MEMKSTREAFGEALVELGRENNKVVVLSGDLEDSTRCEYFKKEFPERFFNLGIAEQDLVGTAVGLTFEGWIPFVCSFASFLVPSAYSVLRLSVCYNNKNVKLIGSHGGLTVGPDGATAQSLEDFAITRVLPNIRVICPVDALETKKAVRQIAALSGPVYMRLARIPFPVITQDAQPFEIGKANILRRGKDVSIIACGLMVSEALKAAQMLSREKIEAEVINMHTLKPLDEETIFQSARSAGAIVTAEEHQMYGGLGSAVAEVLGKRHPVPLEMVAVRDTFGESGEPEELLIKHHLKDTDIVSAAKKALKRKRGVILA